MRVHLATPVSDVFGAGTCGKYLLREMAKSHEVTYDPLEGELFCDDDTYALVKRHLKKPQKALDYPMVQFAGPNLERQSRFAGSPTIGYVFSEWEPLTREQKHNLNRFDRLAAGSEWNARVIRDAGFECAAVPQGVDRDVFKPMPREHLKNKFVVYSGGKWEHRKAQDLVISAVKALQDRHDDIALMASWANVFNGENGYDKARAAGVKLVGLPLMTQPELAQHMNQTDVGLFPNRAEGGTNLILMDYLACGKPAVANVSTGQRDVVRDDYAFAIEGSDAQLVEQMIEKVEMLYQNRIALAPMGAKAATAMDDFPWSRTANGLLATIEERVAA